MYKRTFKAIGRPKGQFEQRVSSVLTYISNSKLPLEEEDGQIGEKLGISRGHVNRCIRALRQRQVIRVEQSRYFVHRLNAWSNRRVINLVGEQ